MIGRCTFAQNRHCSPARWHRTRDSTHFKPLCVIKTQQPVNLAIKALFHLAADDQPVTHTPRALRGCITEQFFGLRKEPDAFGLGTAWIRDGDFDTLTVNLVECRTVKRHGQGAAPLVKARAVSIGYGARPDRQWHGQCRVLRNANQVGTGRPAGIHCDVQALALLRVFGYFDIHQKGMLCLVDMVHKPADDQRLGHRCTHRSRSHTIWQLPCELKRRPCIAGVYPIIMPAGFGVHDDCDRHNIAGCGAIGFDIYRCAHILRRCVGGRLCICPAKGQR